MWFREDISEYFKRKRDEKSKKDGFETGSDYIALVNLTGLEPDSLKKFFFASFDANNLVVFGYDGGRYRLNPLKKSLF